MLRSRDFLKGYSLSLSFGVMVGFLGYSIEHPPFVSPVSLNLTAYSEFSSVIRSYLTNEDSEDPSQNMQGEEKTLARNGSRVLCIMFSHLGTYRLKADHAYDTWAKKCDYTFVAAEKPDPTGRLPVATLNLTDKYENLWRKTKLAFTYAWEHYKDKVDWFVKCDDDTYMVVENLKLLLSCYDPETPIWFGCKSQAIVDQGYMSGGAGYILSRAATRRFVEGALKGKLLRPEKGCAAERDTGAEDADIGLCLEAMNVTAGDSRDFRGRNRFMPVPFEDFMSRPVVAERTWWLWQSWLYYAPDEWRCCSSTPIACHYVAPHRMHLHDYLVYRLHAHGHTRAIYMGSPPDSTVARGWVGR